MHSYKISIRRYKHADKMDGYWEYVATMRAQSPGDCAVQYASECGMPRSLVRLSDDRFSLGTNEYRVSPKE